MLNEYMVKMYIALFNAKCKVDEFIYDEDGEVNIVAMIIILAIAIALAVVFRKNIKDLFDRIWGTVSSNTDNAITGY